MRVGGHGLMLDLPPAWDGRVVRHCARLGEETYPVLQVATFPLPMECGDFGSGAVERMGRDDVLVVLNEYGSESIGTLLFRHRGLPRFRPADFAPNQLQRLIPGQSGCQRFFTLNGRAFCIYVVLGSHARRVPLSRRANALIAGLVVA